MTVSLLVAFAWAVALALAVPTAWLLVQVVAARGVIGRPDDVRDGASDTLGTAVDPDATPRGSVAVLVPAHDEADGIARTLRAIAPQLRSGDRLVVVADNCSDDTARIARDEGADVVERVDASRRGKGYALDAGVRALEARPPECVVIVDADCTLSPGSLDRLAACCAATGRPAQALYLMHAPPGAGRRARMAAFAWAVRNHARPLGGHRLGLPCQLMGSGMSFPWPLLQSAHLASGEIVEDMKLGFDLADGGHAPSFCASARVDSRFPDDDGSARVQRTRWERGHLVLMVRLSLPTLVRSVFTGRWQLAALALDLCVPPLALLVLALVVQLAIDLALGMALARPFFGPALIGAATLGACAAAVVVAWSAVGRRLLAASELLQAPLYILAKLPLYARLFSRASAAWNRTARKNGGDVT